MASTMPRAPVQIGMEWMGGLERSFNQNLEQVTVSNLKLWHLDIGVGSSEGWYCTVLRNCRSVLCSIFCASSHPSGRVNHSKLCCRWCHVVLQELLPNFFGRHCVTQKGKIDKECETTSIKTVTETIKEERNAKKQSAWKGAPAAIGSRKQRQN